MASKPIATLLLACAFSMAVIGLVHFNQGQERKVFQHNNNIVT